MTDKNYSPEIQHDYVTPGHANFATTITVDGKRHPLRFENGRLTLYGEMAKELDRLLALPTTQCALSTYVKKVDRAVAEQIVAAHRANRGEAAKKGSFDTSAGMRMRGLSAHASAAMQQTAAPNNLDGLVMMTEQIVQDAEKLTPPPASTGKLRVK